ncbi:Ig-like domain-containing protein, partial [Flavobacteriaceae bacterium TK19130]|nr:Ig-like domain-containing protein [Thermobacterium salinum]
MKRFLRFPTIIAKHPFIKQLIVALIFGFAGTTFGQQVSVNQTVTPDPNDCSKFDVNVEITGQGPASPVEVVLVIDRSGSMDDGPFPEPIDYAKDAAVNFVQNLFDPANNPTGQNRVAIVSYATTATTDIGLTGSSGEQSVINAINGIVTNGNTNIQSGLVKADQFLINNATFDCKTSRNIILLTDGVTNRDNSGNACSNNAWNTICQQNAIQAGINAQTTTNNGEQFTQNVFSIGLFNAISGNQQNIATNTIDNIQNAGLFTTESGADLSDIYDEILGNLAAAASQIGNNPFFKNILEPGFEYVSGSISESKGNATFSGNVLSWYVNQLLTETITLEYTIMADGSGDACGDQNTGVSYLKYKDPECSVVEDQLPGEDICVPCNDIDPTFSRQDCTNSFSYAANPAGASCSGSSTSYAWEFFLNGTSVGTANNESGTFVYSGGQPLTGELTAEVTATNSSGACNLPSVTETISTGLACDIEDWAFVCGDDKKVDEYGYNANCSQNTNITIPDAGNVYQYVVEIVYKGNNPGETLQFTDSNNVVHTLNRSVPVGSSSNIWVYRGLIEANTSSVNYATSSGLACKLQSVVVYAFRNVPLASSSSGVFSSRSGYNDIQTINVTIPSFSGPRDLFIETPVSELTDDGRYLLIRAEAGGVSNEVIIYGPDSSLPGGSCCLNIPSIVLDDVPGNATDVTITVDSRNGQNGQSVNGQSWVIASGVNVDGDCFSELELSLDNKEDILCNGDNTGSITVAVDGGLAPFEYSLNGGTPQSSPVFENLTAGVYTVTVTDAIGNTDSISVTLEEPEPISIQITKENASQTGGCANGTATANPSGGVAPFTYQWSASASDQTTQTATNLPSGTHTVVVTDANGCTSEQGVVIDCVDDCDAVISVDNVMNVLCAGELTGSATVSASSVANPTATYTFVWNTSPIQTDSGVTSSTISNVGAGVYTVSVTIDGTQCLPVEQSVTITEPNNALNVTATSTDENGPDTNDGTATANATGGTPPYSYSWSPGGEITQTITGLSDGTYTVTVTDANGCTATASTTVNPGTCQNLTASTTSTPVTCNGDSDGSASVSVSGGVGPFTYSWSPGGQTSTTITGLSAGTYTVTVTDETTQCTVTSTTTVNEPNALSSGIAVTNVKCFGDNTGSLDLTVTGGTQPYSFQWDNAETTEDLFNLVAGTYSVTITDANGCTTTDSATVQQPSEGLDLTFTKTDVLCNGESTGAIDITVSGGTQPYSYAWSNGETTEDLNDIPAGSYNITVTDANGCTVSQTGINIDEPANPISIVITKENATTAQGCTDGEATATVTGGTAPYTYQWSASAGNQTTQTAINLPSGTHTVLVTDANGCTLEQGVVIDCTNTCDAVISVDDKTDVLCTSEETGSATVSASSNANPGATFTFTWNTVPQQVDAGVTTSTISGLAAGVYTVSVTIDGTVCQPVEQSVTITEPANALNVTATATDESGPTTGDGTATATPSGGTPPYTYSWSPGGETTQTITGLSAGNYTVTVTDANGCTATATVTVNPGTCLDLAANATATPVSCFGGNDGTASVNVTGGSGDFSYSWAPNGETTTTITDLVAGVYTVTVTDNVTQCTATATATVNEPNDLTSGIAVTNVDCFGNNTGSLDLTVSGGTAPYTFEWTPGGETTEDLFNLVAGTYSVTITDANGCTTTNSATVSEPANPLALTITEQNDIVCDAIGSVTVEASGGTQPYSYNIDGGGFQSSGTFGNLEEGSYTISVLDANGCTEEITVTILRNCTVAIDDINNTFINETVSGNVLTNDFDLEGDTQTVTSTTVTTAQGVTVTIDATTGEYSYTPPVDFTGEDSFEYTVCDNGNPQACDTAIVYIEVVPQDGPENNAPIANADTNVTQVDEPVSGNVLPNDYDPDGDPIAVTGNTDPSNGTVTVNPDGSYTYTPNPGFVGEDTFEYTICDNGNPALCDTTVVTIQVLDDDGNLTHAVDDAYYTTIDQEINGNVLDNDVDPENNGQTVDVAISPSNGPSNGTVTLNADGTFTYVPNPGYTGSDSFVYSIFDNGNPVATDSATVVILVGTIGNEILAIDDINDTFVNLPVSGNVSTNDINADGPAGTEIFTLVSGPTNGGTLVFNPDGTYTYTPATDYTGQDTFVYEVCDGGNPVACDTATVYIEVLPLNGPGNEAPIANADTNTTEQDTPVSGNVLPNDYDPDGDPIAVT